MIQTYRINRTLDGGAIVAFDGLQRSSDYIFVKFIDFHYSLISPKHTHIQLLLLREGKDTKIVWKNNLYLQAGNGRVFQTKIPVNDYISYHGDMPDNRYTLHLLSGTNVVKTSINAGLYFYNLSQEKFRYEKYA